MLQYLQMLADSLKKKSSILELLQQESEHQAELVKAEAVDWSVFDASVERKGELIDELNRLDEGFEILYDRIKEGLNKDREAYKAQILEMQALIREVTEKSTNLMATEERNKNLVTNRFAEEKRKFKQQKTSSRVATNYYNSMNKMNYIDPQLMDQKK